jgi:hypothetical protein
MTAGVRLTAPVLVNFSGCSALLDSFSKWQWMKATTLKATVARTASASMAGMLPAVYTSSTTQISRMIGTCKLSVCSRTARRVSPLLTVTPDRYEKYLYKQSTNMTENQEDLAKPLTCRAFPNFVHVSISHRIPGLRLESQRLRAYLAMSGTESCVEIV